MKVLARIIPALGILAALVLVVIAVPAPAQSRRFELASHFTFLDVGERAPGLGATLTYNLNRRFGLESTLNFFPGDPLSNLGSRTRPVLGGWNTGNILQGQFGARVIVLRSKNTQFFIKAKPGFVSFSDVRYHATSGIGGLGSGDVAALAGRQTSFALDVGGGAEFHPNQRIFVRFDIGDTYFRYNAFTTTLNGPAFAGFSILPVVGFRGAEAHTLQLSTGIGMRLGRSQ
jgi:hypothetical protein